MVGGGARYGSVMRLVDGPRHVTVRVTGYQSPESPSRLWRYSWLAVEGDADDGRHVWSFRFPALSSSDAPRVGPWLRSVAVWLDDPEGEPPGRLAFSEPNLAFRVLRETTQVRVTVSQEFSPSPVPASRGDYDIDMGLTAGSLRAAADEWDEECRPFPDVLATFGPELTDELQVELLAEVARWRAERLRREATQAEGAEPVSG